MNWDAGTVIEGGTYYVELLDADGTQMTTVTPERALELADLTETKSPRLAHALRDAAFEPEWCTRDCDRYAIDRGLCDLHASVAS